MKIAIIIPVLNPNIKLIELTNELIQNKFDNIIIVDDGSEESYKKIYKQISKNIKIIYHDKNYGKGHALKTGIKLLDNIDAFITVDADGQHKVSDIIKIKKSLKNNDVVFGIRDLTKSNVPLRSKFGSKFSSIYYKIKTGKVCKDTQTGLRGINIKYKELCLNTSGERYDYEMNFLFNITKQTNINYVPIETIYENNNSSSHFRLIEDSFLIYKKYILSLLLGIIIITILIVLWG